MTKAKHTPGPWAWEKSHLGEGGYTYQSLVPAELADHPDYEGGEAIVFHCAGWKIKKADAALISAAPDLLTVLKLSNNILEALHASESRADARIMLGKQIMANRAVMEKAGGQ